MLATLTLQKVVQDEQELEDVVEQLESLGFYVDVETYDEDEPPSDFNPLEEDFGLHGLVDAES